MVATSNDEVLSDVLLNQIYTDADGKPACSVTCGGFLTEYDPAMVESALEKLQDKGSICLRKITEPAELKLSASLTNDGAAWVEDGRKRWNNSLLRDRAARNALLAWLYEQRGAPQGSVPIMNFLCSPRSVIGGRFFITADIEAASAYICDKGLAQGTAFVDEQDGPAWARLTADGIDCIEQGGDVAEYLKPHPTGVTYNFNAPVSGTNVAVGDHATQYAAVHGIDANSLRTLMMAIVEALPSLELDAHGYEDAKDATNSVISELAQSRPNHARLRAALAQVRGILAYSGKQALAAVLNGVIDYERTKLGLPPAK